jgi:hypothetical protein
MAHSLTYSRNISKSRTQIPTRPLPLQLRSPTRPPLPLQTLPAAALKSPTRRHPPPTAQRRSTTHDAKAGFTARRRTPPRPGSYLDEARRRGRVRNSTAGCCFLGDTSSTVGFCFLAITSTTVGFCFLSITSSTVGFCFLASHRTGSATSTMPPTSSLFHLDEVW